MAEDGSKVTSMAAFRQAASVLLQRVKFFSRVGKTFADKRDMYATLGYSRRIEYDQYKERYLRDGIATRIVDSGAKATWRRFPAVFDTDDSGEESEFNKLWSSMVLRLRLAHRFERADRVSGLGHYGVLVIGAPGAFESPLRKVSNPEEIAYLSSYGENRAFIKEFDANQTSERFGLPHIYKIDFRGELETSGALTSRRHKEEFRAVPVHHSRVIHIAEDVTDDDVFGRPRLEKVWNRLDDLEKVIGGTSEAVWRNAERGIQWDLDKDINPETADLTKFSDEIDEFMHDMKRYVKTRGVTANVLGSEVPNPKGAFEDRKSVV